MANPKILWPTDFSTSAAQALHTVKERVRLEAAEIHLLYVTESLTEFERYWGSGPDAKRAENLRQFAEHQSRKRLQEICDCELQGCKSYELHFALGKTSEEILKAIDELGVDEVIMAKPPVEGETSFGAAAEEVIRRSPVKVTAIDAPPPSGAPACSDKG
jgi:nucleotide-binding universal stress UspA family protein